MFSPLILSMTMFILGSLGMALSKKSILITLISLELLLLSANINFVVFSIFLDDFLGQIYSLMILTIGAAESALGLAIIIVYYRLRGGMQVDSIDLLKS